jgi:hypothetical protein
MIDHTGVGMSDPARSRNFYERALAPIGYSVLSVIPPEHTGGAVVLGLDVAPKPDFPDGHNIEVVCHDPAS